MLCCSSWPTTQTLCEVRRDTKTPRVWHTEGRPKRRNLLHRQGTGDQQIKTQRDGATSEPCGSFPLRPYARSHRAPTDQGCWYGSKRGTNERTKRWHWEGDNQTCSSCCTSPSSDSSCSTILLSSSSSLSLDALADMASNHPVCSSSRLHRAERPGPDGGSDK